MGNTKILEELLGQVKDLRRQVEELQALEVPGASPGEAIGLLMAMTGLVGAWPGNILAGARDLIADVSGNGLHLSRTGSFTGISYGSSWTLLPAYLRLNGFDGYFSHADHVLLDIIGNEAAVVNTAGGLIRGLTLGGWFRFNNPAGANAEILIGKMSAFTHQASAYFLQRVTSAFGGRVIFRIGDGTNFYTASSTGEVLDDTWHFIAGRYRPSEELKLWIDKETTTESNSIPSTLQNTNDPFAIGARAAAGDNFFNGQAALCFLCAAAVPDPLIEHLYRRTRGLFS